MTKDERYTLEEDLRWVAARTPGARADAPDPRTIFDLDAAACLESFWAYKYYTKSDDGLRQPWFGKVFINIPFSKCKLWVKRAWQAANEPLVQSVSMIIPGNRIEQPFYQTMIEPFRDGRDGGQAPFSLQTWNFPKRLRFGFPGNVGAVGVGSPPFVCTALVWYRREVISRVA